MIPKTPVGLPKSKQELDTLCQTYQTGMACMDSWMRKCLPTDSQKVVQQQIGGARALMKYLCSNDTALRREYIRETSCWAQISPDWSNCVEELQVAARDISERTQQLTYFNRNAELCCARDSFMTCVIDSGRICTSAASSLLRRMAWVLAKDIASCTQQPKTKCSATSMTGSLLVLMSIAKPADWLLQ